MYAQTNECFFSDVVEAYALMKGHAPWPTAVITGRTGKRGPKTWNEIPRHNVAVGQV